MIKHIRQRDNNPLLKLRVAVEGGGVCKPSNIFLFQFSKNNFSQKCNSVLDFNINSL